MTHNKLIEGLPRVWRGHLCAASDNEFVESLRTLCDEKSVPSGGARTGRFEDVHCSKCIAALRAKDTTHAN
ncbi:hypothetical protein WJS89_10375 [Sphingomicrobium sp. XHP0235]|uniref:hypothetical protein n=1 Tax=Sphingomicrobium aquimarinum TaxID=3133971 RepID=UPI0031FE6EF0